MTNINPRGTTTIHSFKEGNGKAKSIHTYKTVKEIEIKLINK